MIMGYVWKNIYFYGLGRGGWGTFTDRVVTSEQIYIAWRGYKSKFFYHESLIHRGKNVLVLKCNILLFQ